MKSMPAAKLIPTAVSLALVALVAVAPSARGEDLLQIYREAQQNDPVLAAARASWTATQEAVPQARAGLLPNVSGAGSANLNNFSENIRSDPPVDINNRNFRLGALSVSFVMESCCSSKDTDTPTRRVGN